MLRDPKPLSSAAFTDGWCRFPTSTYKGRYISWRDRQTSHDRSTFRPGAGYLTNANGGGVGWENSSVFVVDDVCRFLIAFIPSGTLLVNAAASASVLSSYDGSATAPTLCAVAMAVVRIVDSIRGPGQLFYARIVNCSQDFPDTVWEAVPPQV